MTCRDGGIVSLDWWEPKEHKDNITLMVLPGFEDKRILSISGSFNTRCMQVEVTRRIFEDLYAQCPIMGTSAW